MGIGITVGWDAHEVSKLSIHQDLIFCNEFIKPDMAHINVVGRVGKKEGGG